MPTWYAIQAAVQAGMVAASQLADAKVYWKNQNAVQPARPFVALWMSTPIQIGQDSLISSTDLARPAGQEIGLTVMGLREISLSVEVQTDATVATSGSPDGAAAALAELMRTRLRLPSVRNIFTAAGITPFETGAVQAMPVVLNTGYVGRALLEVRLSVVAEAVEDRTGYIAAVDTPAGITAKGGQAGDIIRPLVLP